VAFGNTLVIMVVIGSAKCRWLSARFALVEAATRTDLKDWPEIIGG
jgi:hypothetical protein